MLSVSPIVSFILTWPFTLTVPFSSSIDTPGSLFPLTPRQNDDKNNGASLAGDTRKFYSDALCTEGLKEIERESWKEASKYAEALASWRVNGAYQEAMDVYMGNDSRGPLGMVVEANIVGAVNVHTESTWPEKQKLFVMCQEPRELIEELAGYSECDEQGTFAYAFGDTGKYFENHYVIFCPLFYESPTLYEALLNTSAPTNDIRTYLWNRGQIYFHESLHFADLTTPLDHPIGDSATSSRMDPHIYGPEEVIKEAREQNTAGCVHTADAYTCAAAAILGQQKWNLTHPPLPFINVSTIPASDVQPSKRHLVFSGDLPRGVRDYLPDPHTPDNHIVNNKLSFGPAMLKVADSADPVGLHSRHWSVLKWKRSSKKSQKL